MQSPASGGERQRAHATSCVNPPAWPTPCDLLPCPTRFPALHAHMLLFPWLAAPSLQKQVRRLPSRCPNLRYTMRGLLRCQTCCAERQHDSLALHAHMALHPWRAVHCLQMQGTQIHDTPVPYLAPCTAAEWALMYCAGLQHDFSAALGTYPPAQASHQRSWRTGRCSCERCASCMINWAPSSVYLWCPAASWTSTCSTSRCCS